MMMTTMEKSSKNRLLSSTQMLQGALLGSFGQISLTSTLAMIWLSLPSSKRMWLIFCNCQGIYCLMTASTLRYYLVCWISVEK